MLFIVIHIIVIAGGTGLIAVGITALVGIKRKMAEIYGLRLLLMRGITSCISILE